MNAREGTQGSLNLSKAPRGNKIKEERISLRDERLPPCWLRVNEEGARIQETFVDGAIWQTNPSGQLRSILVESIDTAEDIVCITSFLFADPEVIAACLRAAERGVRVYLLTASEAHLAKEPREDNEFDAERMQQHIETLQRVAGLILVRTSPQFHAKFVLVDPKGSNPHGFLLTANLTSEALTRNLELAVKLTANLVRGLFTQFITGFWTESENELLKPDKLGTVTPARILHSISPTSALCTTEQIKTLRNGILELIDRSTNEIIVATFGITPQHEVTKRLIMAAQTGRTVRILTRPRPSSENMAALIELAQAGATIRAHRWLHGKAILVDTTHGLEGLVMTANIEEKGLDSGFESGVPLLGKNAEALRLILDEWWNGVPYELSLNSKVGEVEGDILIWREGRLEQISIQKLYEKDLGPAIMKSQPDGKTVTSTSIPHPSVLKDKTLYHDYVFRWSEESRDHQS